MAGIYIHVPFCKTRCAYCDFFSTTLHDMKSRYVDALCQELIMRRNYLHDAPIGTLYFGGGTPSQLSENDFHSIFNQIEKVYGLEACEEITLEANPDDLTDDYVEMLTTLPFNRISMGIQTFHEPTLQLIGRRHTAQEAIEAVHRCQQHGFTNISIDGVHRESKENSTLSERMGSILFAATKYQSKQAILLVDEADVKRILEGVGQVKDDVIREHYRVLLQLVIEKNPRFIEAIRGDQMMEDVLMEIVKDRVDEKVNAKEQQTTVTHIRDIMESFGVTIEKAMDSLKIPQSQRSTCARLVGKKTR